MSAIKDQFSTKMLLFDNMAVNMNSIHTVSFLNFIAPNSF